MESVKTGYMCRTEFCKSLELTPGGNIVYPTVDALRHNEGCTSQCGAVKVEIRVVGDLLPTEPSGWEGTVQ